MGKKHHKKAKHREEEKRVNEHQADEHHEHHKRVDEQVDQWQADDVQQIDLADGQSVPEHEEKSAAHKVDRSEEVEQSGLDEEKISEALRFSLSTLLGIADKIKEVDPLRQKREPKPAAKNILDPNYQRPWWSLFVGLAGGYVAYRLYKKEKSHGEK